MDLLTKLKDKAQEHAILGLFALIVLLSLIIWREVPSATWDKVSEVTPKPALWALTGLLVIATILQCAYILILHKKLTSKNTWRFGILWDQDGAPRCPTCANFMGSDDKDGFWCAHCNRYWTLTDDDGDLIDRIRARQIVMKP